jgi:hypothetical protein
MILYSYCDLQIIMGTNDICPKTRKTGNDLSFIHLLLHKLLHKPFSIYVIN